MSNWIKLTPTDLRLIKINLNKIPKSAITSLSLALALSLFLCLRPPLFRAPLLSAQPLYPSPTFLFNI